MVNKEIPIMRQKGFSLLELMVALGILSAGVLGLLSLSVTTLKANYLSQNSTAALQLAQEKMEFLKALPFEEMKGGSESGLTAGTVRTLFRRETIVNKQGAYGLAEITVRVLWPSPMNSGKSQVTEIFTKIAG
jgi:prepilin-type N-terminal cleavage/methylation domain-containing protein